MANTDPRVALDALNDHVEHFNPEDDKERAWLQQMVLVRAVLMVACELRGLRLDLAASRDGHISGEAG